VRRSSPSGRPGAAGCRPAISIRPTRRALWPRPSPGSWRSTARARMPAWRAWRLAPA